MLFSDCRLAEFFDVLFLYCNWWFFWHKHNQFPSIVCIETMLSTPYCVSTFHKSQLVYMSGSMAEHSLAPVPIMVSSTMSFDFTVILETAQLCPQTVNFQNALATLGSLHFYQCWEQDDKCFRKIS